MQTKKDDHAAYEERQKPKIGEGRSPYGARLPYPDPPEIMAAVRSLRTALRLTQTDFGRLLGKSLPTIQRWETLRPPRGRALAQLYDVARRQDESDLECRNASKVFYGALAEEMGGVPAPHAIRGQRSTFLPIFTRRTATRPGGLLP